jgi:hypothetical protein
MTRNIQLACLGATLCTAVALAQTSTSPVAYVYVSNTVDPNTGITQINAYSAAANGRLTAVSGSPFQDNVNYMVVNGLYLFGSDPATNTINAYSIQPDGSLTFSSASSVQQPGGCDSPGSLVLDHTGQSLYNTDFYGNSCANSTYQSFAIQKWSGQLNFLNEAGGSPALNSPLSFIGNNVFAYSSSCYHFSPLIYGFQRNADGSLAQLSLNQTFPAAPAGDGWCPYLAAADTANHLAIPMQPYAGYGSPAGPYQLATYTADGSGNLTTNSTYQNMPAVAVGSVTSLNMAPSGRLLAVGGSAGLQVFHMYGANPITPYTGLLTKDEIDQMFWDNQNHLYALSRTAGKLYVFTVTPTGYRQAPGSPYAIANADNVIVQPWPLPWAK